MEYVWILPSAGEIPHWIDDQDIHNGIHAMLKHDQCLKKWQHLGVEADNLYHWYGAEVTAVELAMHTQESKFFQVME